ncbi:hypothetical protein LCGC14_2035250 [marine sediment metagenome]|uniref:Uncharacterized protein n=1 Tax=marine sediment metagenome TaxID=412755 RepID=A0A0F9ETQ7_9ZZZZ
MTLAQAIRKAESKAKRTGTEQYVIWALVYEDFEYAICDLEALDTFFCGTPDSNILHVT